MGKRHPAFVFRLGLVVVMVLALSVPSFAFATGKQNVTAKISPIATPAKPRISVFAAPQISITGHVTGNLSAEIAAALAGEDPLTIEELSISGQALDAADFAYLRDSVCGAVAGSTSTGVLGYLDISETETTEIPERAFYPQTNVSGTKNTTLQTVVLPDNIASIGDYAFRNCTALSTMNFAPGMTVGFYSCANTGFTELDFSEGIITGGDAFSDCTQLEIIYFGGSVYLNDETLSGCSSLDYFVVLPDTVWDNFGSNNTYDIPATSVAIVSEEMRPWRAEVAWPNTVYYQGAIDPEVVEEGGSATFTVTLSDKDGSPVPNAAFDGSWFDGNFEPISGATGFSYTASNLSAGDTFYFECSQNDHYLFAFQFSIVEGDDDGDDGGPNGGGTTNPSQPGSVDSTTTASPSTNSSTADSTPIAAAVACMLATVAIMSTVMRKKGRI